MLTAEINVQHIRLIMNRILNHLEEKRLIFNFEPGHLGVRNSHLDGVSTTSQRARDRLHARSRATDADTTSSVYPVNDSMASELAGTASWRFCATVLNGFEKPARQELAAQLGRWAPLEL